MSLFSRRPRPYTDTSPESVLALRNSMLLRARRILDDQRRFPPSTVRALEHALFVLEKDCRCGMEMDTETVRALSSRK